MPATYDYDPGLVFDDLTNSPFPNQVGDLYDKVAGTIQQAYDINGNPIAHLTSNQYGYVARFRADVATGAMKFGNFWQPVTSTQAQNGAAAVAQATAANNSAAAAASQAQSAAQSSASSATAAQQAAAAAQAVSGASWNTLTGKPTTFPPTIGNTSTTAVAGNDSRLTDARVPLAHLHAAADITSGTVAPARLGSGTADSTTFLRGDGTWVAVSGGTASLTGQQLTYEWLYNFTTSSYPTLPATVPSAVVQVEATGPVPPTVPTTGPWASLRYKYEYSAS